MGSPSEPEHECGAIEVAQFACAETADGLAEALWAHRRRLLYEDASR